MTEQTTTTNTTTAATAPPKQGSKALRALAYIASYVFHPVFMPTIMAYALYKLSPVSFAGVPERIFFQWLLSIGLSTLFFPLLSVALMKGLGFIQSIHLHTTKDRIIPLMAAMIFYFWIDHVFSSIPNVPVILHILLLGCYLGIIAIFMINIFYKISMHATAAGGVLGILIVLMIMSPVSMVIPVFAAIAIAGIVGTARMILGAHKIWEIWLGYILGISLQLGAWYYLA